MKKESWILEYLVPFLLMVMLIMTALYYLSRYEKVHGKLNPYPHAPSVKSQYPR